MTEQVQQLAEFQSDEVWDFIKKVDRMYRGCGIPALYGTLSVLANKSVAYIGIKGTGKGRTMKTIPKIQGTYEKYWHTLTYEETSNYCAKIIESEEEKKDKCVYGKHLIWYTEDFNTFSQQHRRHFLGMVGCLISEGFYCHKTRHSPYLCFGDEFHPQKNCKLTYLVGIQPKRYSALCKEESQWQSMTDDRFSKFVVLNPLRGNRDQDIPFRPTFTKTFNINDIYCEDRELKWEKLKRMFRGQISEGRWKFYARDYSKALAGFKGKKVVEQEDLDEFYSLFHPYLETFNELYYAETPSDDAGINASEVNLVTALGKSLKPVRDYELCRMLHIKSRRLKDGQQSKEVSAGHIRRVARGLLRQEKPLIQKHGESPNPIYYSLSPELLEFFKEYERRLMP